VEKATTLVRYKKVTKDTPLGQGWKISTQLLLFPMISVLLWLCLPLHLTEGQNIYLYLLHRLVYIAATGILGILLFHVGMPVPPKQHLLVILIITCVMMVITDLLLIWKAPPDWHYVMPVATIVPTVPFFGSMLWLQLRLTKEVSSFNKQNMQRSVDGTPIPKPERHYIKQFIALFLLCGSFLLNFLACQYYVARYYEVATNPKQKVIYGFVFPLMLIPLRTLSCELALRVDRANEEYAARLVIWRQALSGRDVADIPLNNDVLEDDAHVLDHGQLAPLATWASDLFQLIYYRQLFVGVTDWETFAAFQAVALVQQVAKYPFRMTRWYFDKYTQFWAFVDKVQHKFSKNKAIVSKLEKKIEEQIEVKRKATEAEELKKLEQEIEERRKAGDSDDDSAAPSRTASWSKPALLRWQTSLAVLGHDGKEMNVTDLKFEMMRRGLSVEFYTYCMAMRISLMAYLAHTALLRRNWNSEFFPYNPRVMSQAFYERFNYFLLAMLAVEWTISTIVTIVIRQVSSIDVITAGAYPLVNRESFWRSQLMGIHILMDSYLSSNSMSNFTWT
jgi:hypothetical protein